MNRYHIWNRLASVLMIGVLGLSARTTPAQSLRMVPETSGPVSAVAFSPDARTLATGGTDKTVRLWDVATGRELRTLAGHTDSVNSVAFSPDGRTLASGSQDRLIRVWDVETGKELRTLVGHTSPVTSVEFSPDGRTLASGSGDDTVRLWEVGTGKALRTLAGHTDYVTSVAFSPDGRTLASGSGDKTIRLWNVETGKELRNLAGHTEAVFSVAFSPDARTLASGSIDLTVRLWDVLTGKELRNLAGHTGNVSSVAFSRDGRTLASGSWDQTIRLWDVGTGKQLSTLAGHTDLVNSVAFSSDGRTLASGSFDKTIRLWDVETGKTVRTLEGHPQIGYSVAFSPDARTLATGSWDGPIRLWDVGTGKELRTLADHANFATPVAFSPDGRVLASGSLDGPIRLWDVETGKELHTLSGHTKFVLSVAFSPDGRTLASGSGDMTVRLWDVETGRAVRTLAGHADIVRSVAFSPDGRTLASGSYDKTLRLWDVETGRTLRTLAGHTGAVTSVAFSPDGRTLASGSGDKTIRLWDMEAGNELGVLAGHARTVFSVAFSPDGRTLASGSWDKTIRLWDVGTGKEFRTLAGHTDMVTSVAFSLDGSNLASASWDGPIRLWDGKSGQARYTRYGFDDGSWIVIAPDGRYDSSEGPRPRFGHFVMDLPGEMPEVVAFDQVRTKDYYEPDLVSKIMSGAYKPGEQPLLAQKPAPNVEFSVAGDKVKFRLTKRFDGGIGQVRINVNGQEVKAFEKGSVASGVWTTWDGKGFVTPLARISVVADNGLETLSSPRGESLNVGAATSSDPIRFVGVAMGVKDYLGSVAHLQYAGADAVAMTRAMLTLAKSLGPTVKPELYLLTDEAVPDDLKGLVTVLPPTKASYDDVVTKLKAGPKFTANTLLFLDFSGHGVMVGDKYVYLTKDSRTADPEQLKNELSTVVTMDEILGFLNLNLAGKRLLVLDTCQAAGAEKVLAANLKQGEDNLDAQKRTVADWQNRYAVGTQVLMGCPEGQASFEDPRYGHGLLTYSLLYCLRNDDLGDKPGDPEVWADRLVADTASQTQKFAEALGLKQDVQPLGAHHFPIGDMTKEDRLTKIVLPNPKPAIGTCTLTDDATDFPADAFNQEFIARVEASPKGATIVHIASAQAPGVWNVSGHYKKGADGHVTMTLHLSQGTKRLTLAAITTLEASAVDDAYAAISKELTHQP